MKNSTSLYMQLRSLPKQRFISSASVAFFVLSSRKKKKFCNTLKRWGAHHTPHLNPVYVLIFDVFSVSLVCRIAGWTRNAHTLNGNDSNCTILKILSMCAILINEAVSRQHESILVLHSIAQTSSSVPLVPWEQLIKFGELLSRNGSYLPGNWKRVSAMWKYCCKIFSGWERHKERSWQGVRQVCVCVCVHIVKDRDACMDSDSKPRCSPGFGCSVGYRYISSQGTLLSALSSLTHTYQSHTYTTLGHRHLPPEFQSPFWFFERYTLSHFWGDMNTQWHNEHKPMQLPLLPGRMTTRWSPGEICILSKLTS